MSIHVQHVGGCSPACDETGHFLRATARSEGCICPDPYCPEHARCTFGHKLIILPGDPAFCPECLQDVMPAGTCG